MTVVPGGPLLVEGPVEVVLPGSDPVRSERPLVAICMCRRSQRFPFCDTSHRAGRRAASEAQGGSGNGRRSED